MGNTLSLGGTKRHIGRWARLNPALQIELACQEDATSLTQCVATAIRLDNLLHQHQACGASGHLIHRCPERPSSAQVVLIDSGAAVNLIDGALVEDLGIPTIPCVPSLRITAIDSQSISGGYLTRQTELLEFQVGLFHREHLAFYVTSSPDNPVILGFTWLRCHDPQISWHTGELVHWSAACFKECLLEPVSRLCRASLVEDSASLASSRIPHVYEDFWEVFSEERAARLPSHQAWDCAIDLLPNASPPRGRVYPLSLPEAKAMEEYIEEALAVGHIWPTTFPAAAGFFFVGKKDGGLPFQQLKQCFTTAPILRHPDPELPFVVEVDASSSGIGAVLSQKHGAPGKLHPCAFYSRKLTATEANYDVGTRELLSIKAAVEEWRHWLEGARHPFLVLTDHRNLEYLRGAKQLNPRLARWALFFTHFQFSVTYRPGSKSCKADALSRQFEVPSEPVPPNLILPAAAILAPAQVIGLEAPAQAAFQQLKQCFTTAPILRHPDPELPFVVEVDASSSGIGAVLSQKHGAPGKLHPCAFYSRKLTATEANYDVGTRELLSIKAAVEEWRHWLEGARHPFLVLTDHRNLEYLRGAKQLNPRLARWALFFTHFQFSVTYRPGSKSCKADALSRQFEVPSEPVPPNLILPAAAILAPVQWSLMEEIQ
ncbi:hypothetical protein QTP70_021980 [Hemibagrus guttatus]|uniref:Reverse transcriptase RNase H-like domain-containing protein n=1 Tax=Hemibagrus guttatus TaxID=175788 RepID=A0AAE0UTB6_9TELE|nr:hypothetical protein QTP70_021980 [Hemibagrus guttatus]